MLGIEPCVFVSKSGFLDEVEGKGGNLVVRNALIASLLHLTKLMIPGPPKCKRQVSSLEL